VGERRDVYKVQLEAEHLVDVHLVGDRVSTDFEKHIARIWSD